jgi:hypothetical protein
MAFPNDEFMDDPDLWVLHQVTGSHKNRGRFSDPRGDDPFARGPPSSPVTATSTGALAPS